MTPSQRRYQRDKTKQAQWYRANVERERAKRRAYYYANRERMIARSCANQRLKRTQFTLAEYRAAWQAQEGRCAICAAEETVNRALAADHDHGTGQKRGLLCARCNRALGQFEDSPVLLQKAIDYLRRHRGEAA